MSDRMTRLGKSLREAIADGGGASMRRGSSDNIRLGIIGVGRHARTNLWPCLSSLPVEIVAVSAAHANSAEKWGRRIGADTCFEGFQTMLENAELDAVLACIDAENHREVISHCLDLELPLYVEKPAALTATEVQALAEKDPDHRVVVGFQKRFAPSYGFIAEAAQKRRMGGLLGLQMEFGVGPMPGGMETFLREVAIHFADLARWFCPGLSLEAVTRREGPGKRCRLSAQFADETGIIGNLHFSSGFDWANCHERVLANFARATVEVRNITDFDLTGHSRTVLGVPLDKVFRHRRYRHGWRPNMVSGVADNSSLTQTGFHPALTHFIRDVAQSGRPSRSSLDNAAASHRLIEHFEGV